MAQGGAKTFSTDFSFSTLHKRSHNRSCGGKDELMTATTTVTQFQPGTFNNGRLENKFLCVLERENRRS